MRMRCGLVIVADLNWNSARIVTVVVTDAAVRTAAATHGVDHWTSHERLSTQDGEYADDAESSCFAASVSCPLMAQESETSSCSADT